MSVLAGAVARRGGRRVRARGRRRRPLLGGHPLERRRRGLARGLLLPLDHTGDARPRQRRRRQFRRLTGSRPAGRRPGLGSGLISHDLRNPLTVAQGRLDLVADEVDSDHLDTAENALDRMTVIVDDVLTLARQE
ncbi:hypothetical protein BRC95_07665 [Halobacteriales archaeon QS_5_68_33]|nr:MAG: hypothetical protein BRC95_07665 [Halobacteriales archaeon QS_5_68_33]